MEGKTAHHKETQVLSTLGVLPQSQNLMKIETSGFGLIVRVCGGQNGDQKVEEHDQGDYEEESQEDLPKERVKDREIKLSY